MSKILKRLVKENLLLSVKGPNGGFMLHPQTLSLPVFSVVRITDGLSTFNNCVLCLTACNMQNPCPLHDKMQAAKKILKRTLSDTTIGALLLTENKLFLESITTNKGDKLSK